MFQIIWSQQQYELKRFKRDFSPTHNVSKSFTKKPVLRFPDPLFVDQWYLVSIFMSLKYSFSLKLPYVLKYD